MKILLKKERKEFVKDINRDVVVQRPEKHLILDTTKDYHTKYGAIKKDFFKKKEGSKTKLGNQEFVLLNPGFVDLFRRIERLAQIIPLKDIGSIITFTGIGKDSAVVDAGSGSGGLSLFLANIVKKASTYDIKKENTELVNRNIKFLGLENITAKTTDIYKADSIKDKNVDIFTLDVPEPWRAIKTAGKILKIGGFLVCYSPCIPPLEEFVHEVKKVQDLMYIKTIEIIERDWEFNGRIVRPKSQQIGHSGFLCFVRKI